MRTTSEAIDEQAVFMARMLASFFGGHVKQITLFFDLIS